MLYDFENQVRLNVATQILSAILNNEGYSSRPEIIKKDVEKCIPYADELIRQIYSKDG